MLLGREQAGTVEFQQGVVVQIQVEVNGDARFGRGRLFLNFVNQRAIPESQTDYHCAFRVHDLQDAAARLGQHFLYANLAHAQSKQDVLDLIAQQFTFPAHFGKNFDALSDCLTDPLHKSGPQPGFIVVLEQIPATAKFDKEAREQLLDVFRDAADYWADRKIPFRCFYSFL